jgi:hypothetical protein
MKKILKKILDFGLCLLILILTSILFFRFMYYLTPKKPLRQANPERYAFFKKLKYYFPYLSFCGVKINLESNNIESDINLFREAIRRRNTKIEDKKYFFWERIIDFFLIDCFVFFYFPYKL